MAKKVDYEIRAIHGCSAALEKVKDDRAAIERILEYLRVRFVKRDLIDSIGQLAKTKGNGSTPRSTRAGLDLGGESP